MAGRQEVDTISELDGVVEVTLCGADGRVLESSSSAPELAAAAVTLGKAVRNVGSSLPQLSGEVTLSIDAASGALHFTQLADSMLIVSTEADTNLGVLSIEIRQALES
jgi:predicted regulator of Ras-like GTPase activity (Roadblock/LC7/MglB family)